MSSEFVEEVFVWLRRRTKAIRYQGELTVTRRTAFNPEQDADLEIEVRMGKVRVRLWLWADRWVWLDAREYGTRRKGGWVWSKTVDGRFFATEEARELVAKFEATMSAHCSSLPADANTARDRVTSHSDAGVRFAQIGSATASSSARLLPAAGDEMAGCCLTCT